MSKTTPLLMRRIPLVSRIALTLLAAPSLAAAAPRIVNGVYTSSYPSTGALLNGQSVNSASAHCSGTLIGCRTFLTAQHCVEGESASNLKVFLQHGGMFDVSSIAVAPGYNFPDGDIAVLTLSTPVTGIAPTHINDIEDPPFGSSGTIVGFGRSGGSNDDYGLKRAGSVTTAACVAPANDDDSVCWDFNSPLGAPGSNANTCNADSGGPLFLTLGGQTVVAGVTSGGALDSCLVGDRSYDADVFFLRNFIASAGGSDITATSCGDIAQAGGDGSVVHGFTGSLSSATSTATHSFTVGSNVEVLRVALNAVDDGFSDFDLFVRAGSAPTQSTYDCARTGGNQYGVCEFNSPAPGLWYAMVTRYSGGGVYQVTTTALGQGCADPAHAGLPCDDGNECTDNDTCTSLQCIGTPANEGGDCGDATLCTGPLVCLGGVCSATSPGPRTSCKHSIDAGKASLSLRNRANDSSDKLQWKWQHGEATSDFGDPTNATDYAVCVYDENGNVPALVLQHELPASSKWEVTNYGYRFSDSTLAEDGMRMVQLRRGEDGRAAIRASGKGSALAMTSLPLHQDSEVIAQLVNSAGACWESKFSSFLKNDSESFKAKGN